jgi:hypothetical protein
MQNDSRLWVAQESFPYLSLNVVIQTDGSEQTLISSFLVVTAKFDDILVARMEPIVKDDLRIFIYWDSHLSIWVNLATGNTLATFGKHTRNQGKC